MSDQKTPMTCVTCHRVVYAADLDAGGRCCFCQPPQSSSEVGVQAGDLGETPWGARKR